MKTQGVQISQPALRARPATFRSALTTTTRFGCLARRARRTIQSSADSTKTLWTVGPRESLVLGRTTGSAQTDQAGCPPSKATQISAGPLSQVLTRRNKRSRSTRRHQPCSRSLPSNTACKTLNASTRMTRLLAVGVALSIRVDEDGTIVSAGANSASIIASTSLAALRSMALSPRSTLPGSPPTTRRPRGPHRTDPGGARRVRVRRAPSRARRRRSRGA